MGENSSFSSMKDIISELLANGSLPFSLDDGRIWKIWPEVVGPVIAGISVPLVIKGGKLKVSVSDPIWFQELQFREKGIREQLNKHLGRKAVTRIEFKVGPLR